MIASHFFRVHSKSKRKSLTFLTISMFTGIKSLNVIPLSHREINQTPLTLQKISDEAVVS